MSGGPAVLGRGGYPIAELSGLASSLLGGRLDAIVAAQAEADEFEDAMQFDGMCS